MQNNKLRYQSFQMKSCFKCVGPRNATKEHANIVGILSSNLSCIALFLTFHVTLTENFPRTNTSDSEMSHGDGSLRGMGLL